MKNSPRESVRLEPSRASRGGGSSREAPTGAGVSDLRALRSELWARRSMGPFLKEFVKLKAVFLRVLRNGCALRSRLFFLP